jgi:hypothetical protein
MIMDTHHEDALLADAGRRARDYLSTIGDRRVAPSAPALAALGRLDFPLPASTAASPPSSPPIKDDTRGRRGR